MQRHTCDMHRHGGSAASTRPPAHEDVWGSDDEHNPVHATPDGLNNLTSSSVLTSTTPTSHARRASPVVKGPETGSAPSTSGRTTTYHQKRQLLRPDGRIHSLHAICLSVLGRYVDQLVQQLGEHVKWLPPDVKASLLAVAKYACIKLTESCRVV